MLPRSLRVVAAIQLLFGLSSAFGILFQLGQGRVNLDFGVLGIPIYFGLKRLSSGWRTCALVLLWVELIIASAMFFLGLAAQPPAYFKVFGVGLASVSPLWLSIAALPLFALALWQYRVLTRSEIRSLFLHAVEGASADQPQPPASAPGGAHDSTAYPICGSGR